MSAADPVSLSVCHTQYFQGYTCLWSSRDLQDDDHLTIQQPSVTTQQCQTLMVSQNHSCRLFFLFGCFYAQFGDPVGEGMFETWVD